jgi:hypothetical protein
MVGPMIPGKYDLKLYRGDSYTWRLILWNDDAKTVPFDLTGAIVESEIRDKPSGAKIIPLTCVITLPNTIDITAYPANSVAAPPKGVWDCQITLPDGTVKTPIGGQVIVVPDVTDST